MGSSWGFHLHVACARASEACLTPPRTTAHPAVCQNSIVDIFKPDNLKWPTWKAVAALHPLPRHSTPAPGGKSRPIGPIHDTGCLPFLLFLTLLKNFHTLIMILICNRILFYFSLLQNHLRIQLNTFFLFLERMVFFLQVYVIFIKGTSISHWTQAIILNYS